MPTAHQEFWTNSSFAFVGHSAEKDSPTLSYGELKKQEFSYHSLHKWINQLLRKC